MIEYLSREWKKIAAAVASALLLSSVFLWFRFASIFAFNDPDLFFHFKISEIWNRSGMPMVLPQYDLIGWDRLFGEKEFLFHAVTALGWKWLQERGVILAALAVTTLNLFQLTYFSSRRLGAVWGFFLSAVILLPSAEFLYRASMVRPQVMGMFFWTWVIFAFLYRSRIAMFLSCALYVLSYHLAAIPLLLLGVYGLVLAIETRSWSVFRKTPEASVVLWGSVGLLCGFVLNPYFPGNVLVSLQVLKIPFLMTSGERIPFGMELYPKASNQYVMSILSAVVCIASLVWARFSERPDKKNAWVISAVLIVLIVLKGFNPRAIEYLVPITLVGLCLCLEKVKSGTVKFIWMMIALVSNSAIGWAGWNELKPMSALSSKLEWALDRRLSVQSLKHLPSGAYKRLFHCEWHQSVFWFYAADEKLKLIDLLDPTFLLVKNIDEYHLRQQLVLGEEKDPFLPLVSAFHADLVACGGGAKLSAQMGTDPRFRRLERFENSLVGRVAAMDQSRSDHFVKAWMASDWDWVLRSDLGKGSTSRSERSHYSVLEKRTQEDQIENQRVLFPLYNPPKDADKAEPAKPAELAKPKDAMHCRQLKTDRQWALKNAGSDLLGWGGGPHLRIWRNSQALFKMEGEQPVQGVLQGLIRLSSPVRADDVFHVMVCAEQKSDSWLSVSAWKDAQMIQWCKEDERDQNPSWRRVTGWQSIGGPRGNCYAAYEP